MTHAWYERVKARDPRLREPMSLLNAGGALLHGITGAHASSMRRYHALVIFTQRLHLLRAIARAMRRCQYVSDVVQTRGSARPPPCNLAIARNYAGFYAFVPQAAIFTPNFQA